MLKKYGSRNPGGFNWFVWNRDRGHAHGWVGWHVHQYPRNRRVEVVVFQPLNDELKEELEVLRTENPEVYQAVRQELIQRFNLSPDEIF